MRRRAPAAAQAQQETPTAVHSSPPKLALFSRRSLALALLCFQNASVAILTRLSRTSAAPTSAAPRATAASSGLYNPAAAVFTAELVKAGLSLAVLAVQNHRRAVASDPVPRSSVPGQARAALADLFRNQRREQLHLAVPAGLYALQNTLLYVALSNLDAATYQTIYQLKLLTTAIFSILFFRHSLSATKWFSLVLLTAGVAVVQLDSTEAASQRPGPAAQDPRTGFAAILAACISSGLAGAWFEWVLKRPSGSPAESNGVKVSLGKNGKQEPPLTAKGPAKPSGASSLWARNLQLAVPSFVFAFAGVLLSRPVRSRLEIDGLTALLDLPGTLWQGFTPLVWAVVLNQALGGLLVAVVVREADSVSKGFATSIAIVLSTLASAVLFGTVPGLLFVTGSGLVISSTVLYSFDRGK
ncbi:hypothetical protein JCM8202_005234 [Rhodotorula sphaerocarpa]